MNRVDVALSALAHVFEFASIDASPLWFPSHPAVLVLQECLLRAASVAPPTTEATAATFNCRSQIGGKGSRPRCVMDGTKVS